MLTFASHSCASQLEAICCPLWVQVKKNLDLWLTQLGLSSHPRAYPPWLEGQDKFVSIMEILWTEVGKDQLPEEERILVETIDTFYSGLAYLPRSMLQLLPRHCSTKNVSDPVMPRFWHSWSQMESVLPSAHFPIFQASLPWSCQSLQSRGSCLLSFFFFCDATFNWYSCAYTSHLLMCFHISASTCERMEGGGRGWPVHST